MCSSADSVPDRRFRASAMTPLALSPSRAAFLPRVAASSASRASVASRGPAARPTRSTPLAPATRSRRASFGIPRDPPTTTRCEAFPPPGLEWIPEPEAVFNAENIAIFPFWLAMIAAPKNPVTKAVMGGYLVPFLCGFVYVYLTWYSFSDPRILEAFSTGQPDLAALSRGFSYERCMAVGWAHFIAMDLFVGRWIYLDSQKNDVFAAHSLLLTLFFGPTGAISHVTTRAITGAVRGKKLDDVMAGALDAKNDA